MMPEPLPNETLIRSDHAYLRLSTPADLHDAIFLALSGVHVAFEPVPGCLTGFGKPFPLRIMEDGGRGRLVVDRSPERFAAAVLALVTLKRLDAPSPKLGPITLAIADPEVRAAIDGIALCLNQRAGRLLGRTDIADLMGWVAGLTAARIDAQLPYGCAEWGAFLRREPADSDLGWYVPPERANFTRSLVCHVRPTEADLGRILRAAPIGLINAERMRRHAPWGAGLSADKRMILGTHCLAPMLSWRPHDAGASVPVLNRETLLAAPDREAAYRLLYGAAWDRVREISAAGYRMTTEAVPEPLQAIWQHQREGLHLYGVDVEEMPPCRPDDLRRHALSGGYDAAAELRLPRPQAALTRTAPTLPAQAVMIGAHVDHNAPVALAYHDGETAQVVAHLHGSWDGFLGGELLAASVDAVPVVPDAAPVA